MAYKSNRRRRPVAADRDAFGDLVRQLRVSSGMSQSFLARRAQVSPGTVGNVECGSRGVSLPMLRRLVDALRPSWAEIEAMVRLMGYLAEGEELVADPLTMEEFLDGRQHRLSALQRGLLIDIYDDFDRRPSLVGDMPNDQLEVRDE